MWNSETQVTSCMLRVIIYLLRVQINELEVSIDKIRVQLTSHKFNSGATRLKAISGAIFGGVHHKLVDEKHELKQQNHELNSKHKNKKKNFRVQNNKFHELQMILTSFTLC